MLIKPGVYLHLLNRDIRRVLRLIEARYPDFVVTSAGEGTHQVSSLHYANDAIDLRLSYPSVWTPMSLDVLKSVVGNGYDVLEEGTHFHIEWDPHG